MNYAKYMRGFTRINRAKLALWAGLLFLAVVAGIAVLGSGIPERSSRGLVKPLALFQDAD
jgi:hypothetical protein